MSEEEIRGLTAENLSKPYENTGEYLQDRLALLDHMLYLYYKYHQWVGPKNDLKNMLGLVVTRQEFEHNVSSGGRRALADRLEMEEKLEIIQDLKIINFRLSITDQSKLSILQLFERFDMHEYEKNCFILALAPLLDEKYEKLFAYLQDDISKKVPTQDLAVNLFMSVGDDAWKQMLRFKEDSPFLSVFDGKELTEGRLVPEPEILGFLNENLKLSPEFLFSDGEKTAELLVHREEARRIDAVFNLNRVIFSVSGPKGIGKHFQVQAACARNGSSCLFADLSNCENTETIIRKAGMLARLTDSCLAFCGVDGPDADGNVSAPDSKLQKMMLQAMPPNGKLFVLSEKPVHLHTEDPILEIGFKETQIWERLELFRYFFKDVPVEEGFSIEEAASKFHFTPQQISQAADQAKGLAAAEDRTLTIPEIHQCCYNQAVHSLDGLATRLTPAFSWDELVLPQDMKDLLKQACSHVHFGHKVYDEWGFGKRIPYGRGLSILFDGPPGTGKTMCARIMASELNMEMYKINISQIVSKYIGETEKNLQNLFREARNADCILFFDECDSLFGKRSEVKDSHDRNANVETAYLLQQIEEYDGVCILATNLLKNIDEAFLRRITYVIHFPFPDAKMREEIYHSTVTEDLPMDPDIDWKFMAETFSLSGGYIKNIVLAAAFRAAMEGVPMNMKHLINCAVQELRKNEIIVVRENLREYADLLDN